jgi:glutathione S-transferase
VIKLWGRTNSSNVMKVIWLLEELGLKYERTDAGGQFGRTGTPEYRAMNPLGLVPSIEDGSFHLFESNAILRYICNAHAPTSALYPQAPQARATVESWMEFQQTALNRPQGVVFLGLARTPPEKRDNAAIEAGAKEAAQMWGILDARLARHPYVAGDALTLADMTFGPHIHRWFALPVPGRPDQPHLRAWYERLLSRPAFKTHVAIAPT